MKKLNQKTKKSHEQEEIRKDILINEKDLKENVKKLEKQIKNRKEIPKEEENKMNKKVFENILIADIIMLFLYFIALGSLNIETSIFITDLKVFSISLIVFTIILFEYSYRKEKGNICIHGIECFFLAVFILSSIYLYNMYFKDFNLIITFTSYIFAIYYTGKSMIVYRKMEKEYIASLSDIEEIIKK